MKKFCLFLFVLMSVSSWAYSFSSVAPSGQTLYFSLSGGTAIVVYPGNSSDYYPATFDRPVDTLVIPDSVTYSGISYPVVAIGDHAFDSCIGLSRVVIPSTVTSIGNAAFRKCIWLRSVELSDNIQSLSDDAFYHCTHLVNITMPSSLRSIGNRAFAYCMRLVEVVVPDLVESIGDYAFYSCADLEHLTLNSSVTSLGRYAFSDCYSLISIDLPSSLNQLSDGVFNYCSALGNVIIPESIETIGDYAFANCSSIDSITIPSSIRSIGAEAFTSMNNLLVVNYNADSCESMGWDGDSTYTPVFPGCPKFKTLNIGSGVKSIPDYAFRSIMSLRTVNFNADRCVYMGTDTTPVFSGCIGITKVNIADNITNIPNAAFADCSELEHIDLPSSVELIGEKAFANAGLRTVSCLSHVPPVFADTLYAGLRLNTLILVNCDDSVVYREAEGWRDFRKIQPYNGITVIVRSSDDEEGTAELVQAPDCVESMAVIRAIPDNYYAFDHWNDGDTTNPRMIVVTQDTSFTAYFVYTGVDTSRTEQVNLVVDAGCKVIVEGDCIVLSEVNGQLVTILDVMGRVIVCDKAVEEKRYQMPAPGVYLVKVGNHPALKVITW